MTALQTLIARAFVRLAIIAAPAEMAARLRSAASQDAGGGGGPAPVR